MTIIDVQICVRLETDSQGKHHRTTQVCSCSSFTSSMQMRTGPYNTTDIAMFTLFTIFASCRSNWVQEGRLCTRQSPMLLVVVRSVISVTSLAGKLSLEDVLLRPRTRCRRRFRHHSCKHLFKNLAKCLYAAILCFTPCLTARFPCNTLLACCLVALRLRATSSRHADTRSRGREPYRRVLLQLCPGLALDLPSRSSFALIKTQKHMK